ncbi:MAG: F0F1 ATP synthase subunit delta [Pseudomonadota bacterium]|nr:F0F1 ATP synthase subunit delta [Pseudomonadota bacterium]|tara:strand:+ start:2330 stop:2866 length:537 start_codon:yes stop_codon:yes gene_type:complete
MSDNYTYARPYAEAAFKTALDDNSLKDWKECLAIISEIVSDMNVKAILANPKVTNAKRMEFLESFLPKNTNNKIIHFLNILLETKRIFKAKEILEIYNSLEEKHSNIKIVVVETPYKLSSSEIKVLQNKFEKEYKSKIEIKSILTKELIAGMRIRIDDQVRDFSARNYLSQLQDQLVC